MKSNAHGIPVCLNNSSSTKNSRRRSSRAQRRRNRASEMMLMFIQEPDAAEPSRRLSLLTTTNGRCSLVRGRVQETWRSSRIISSANPSTKDHEETKILQGVLANEKICEASHRLFRMRRLHVHSPLNLIVYRSCKVIYSVYDTRR